MRRRGRFLGLLVGLATVLGLLAVDADPDAPVSYDDTALPVAAPDDETDAKGVRYTDPWVIRPRRPTTPLAEARQDWDDAIYAAVESGSARYSWASWVVGTSTPLWRERGDFGFFPMRSQGERTLTEPGDEDASLTMRMRRRGDELWLQMSDWGPWDGCWFHGTTADIAREAGVAVDIDDDEGVALPVSVIVPFEARVTEGYAEPWFGSPYVEYEAEVNAFFALQFLGVVPTQYLDDQEELLAIQVPMLVARGVHDRPHGAAMYGAAVAEAIEEAGSPIDDRLLLGVRSLRAAVEYRDYRQAAPVRVPPSEQILPDGATRAETCRASAPGI